MKLEIEKEVAALQKMSVGQLRERYAEAWATKPVAGTGLT
jgi:hypothetical protein